ncbi:MAG: TadE family type IV pilus minor pilin [Pseudonocardia sp.]
MRGRASRPVAGGPAGRARLGPDGGAVTVEAAIALGSVVLVTLVAVGSVAAAASSVRCIDAARELARLGARGEPERGRLIAARLAPAGARIELTTSGDELVADVSVAPVAPLPLRIGARAVAVLEPGAGEEGQ